LDRTGSFEKRSLTLDNLGELLLKQGKPEAARNRYEEALQVSRDTASEEDIASVLLHLAKLLHQKRDLVGATNALDEALPILKRLRDDEGVIEALRLQAELSDQRGDKPRPRAQALRDEAARLEKSLGKGQKAI
jgi:tetratricopeptide (TPR) repeat protein